MNKDLELVLEQCKGVVDREIPLLVLAPEYTKILLDYIDDLQKRINTYENPEDLTLMFMYCDEKAKDKIKDFQQRIDKAIEYIKYNDDTLFTYEPDYDYEENLVDNYDVSSYREDLLKILGGKE